MKSDCAAISKKSRGTAAIEIAVITPVFLMMVFGIIEVGRGMMVKNLVVRASQEGTRLASLTGTTNEDVTSAIQTYMRSALGLAPSNVCVSISTVPAAGNPHPGDLLAECRQGDVVTVKVQVPFEKVALVPGSYLANTQFVGQSSLCHE